LISLSKHVGFCRQEYVLRDRHEGRYMIKRLSPGKRLSMATIHGGVVYLAGQVPDDLSVGVEAQARQVLDKIDALLGEAGTDKSSILSATVWLPNIADFAAFNTVWDAWVPSDASPARACVEARLANPSIRVEIAAIAAIP
jgi:enamine deaminase RidA (YjgF/YER057c/UK114 family)